MYLSLLYYAYDIYFSFVSNFRVGSRTEFATWCCQLHNEVNLQLNKPKFSCDMKDLDARWRDGPECWNQLFEERNDEE